MNKVLKNYKKVALCALVTFSCANRGIAQTSEADTTLETQNVVIVKDFQPTIAGANKINSSPQLIDIKVPKVDFKYNSLPKTFESSFKADTIKAARIKGEPLDKLYRSFLKLGIGNYGTTHARFHLNNLRSRNNRYGLKLYHHGSQGNIKDLPESSFNTNGIELNGKKFLRAHSVGGNIGYDRQKVHFYGYDKLFLQTVDINNDDIKQIYQEIKANGEFESFYADSSSLNYKFNLGYTNFQDNFKNKENNLLVKSKLERYFGKELAQVFINLDYNNQKADSSNNKANILMSINPQIIAKGNKWRFSAGLIAFIENESSTKFRFYPNAHFKYNVFNELVIPYVGITGGMKRNSNNSLRKENPFISPAVDLENTNTRYNFYGGVRGTYSSTISFNIQASKRKVANMALFVNSPLVQDLQYRHISTFGIVYDTINVTQLTAEIGYLRAKKFNLVARADYFSYDPTSQPVAWHLPEFKTTLTARYDLRDKIVLTADIFYVSKRYAKSNNTNDKRLAAGVYGRTLDGFVDANLGIEYRYNKKWGAFLNLNNIAAQEFQGFNYYNTQRFNLLFGLSYSFWGK